MKLKFPGSPVNQLQKVSRFSTKILAKHAGQKVSIVCRFSTIINLKSACYNILLLYSVILRFPVNQVHKVSGFSTKLLGKRTGQRFLGFPLNYWYKVLDLLPTACIPYNQTQSYISPCNYPIDQDSNCGFDHSSVSQRCQY